MTESVSSILESLANSDLDSARKMIQSLGPTVRNERERGALLAAAGIHASISKGKEGTLQSWDPQRIERAAVTITVSQFSDDFDLGFAETLSAYSRLTAKNQPPGT